MSKITIHILLLVSLLSILGGCTEEKKSNSNTPTMETLLYSDGQPIIIEIENGKIEKLVRPKKKTIASKETIYVAPGFIDHQINGYLSYSFVGNDLDEDKVKIITEGLWENGITTFLPTLTSESNELMLRNLNILNEVLKNEHIAQSIPGFHVEGPYISPEDGFRGVHSLDYIREPNWEEFEAWHIASGSRVKEVTIAPELNGAMEFIKKCMDNGIKVALGHTNATSLQISQAVKLGASISTHLGNGCANMIHRHHNPIWPQLSEDGLTASIIVDGFHLTKEEVRTFYKTKGAANIILVSDITRLGGMPPGTYYDFGQEVIVTKEGAIMMPKENVLAGASFLVTKGIENIIRFTGCSLEEAINMVTINPAKALEVLDRGEIAVGKRADLVYFKFDSGTLEIIKTIVGGEVVYDSATAH